MAERAGLKGPGKQGEASYGTIERGETQHPGLFQRNKAFKRDVVTTVSRQMRKKSKVKQSHSAVDKKFFGMTWKED